MALLYCAAVSQSSRHNVTVLSTLRRLSVKCCWPFLFHLYHSGAAYLDESLDETENMKEGRQVSVLEARLTTLQQRRDGKRSVFVCTSALTALEASQAFPQKCKNLRKRPHLPIKDKQPCYCILIDFFLVKIHYENPYSWGWPFRCSAYWEIQRQFSLGIKATFLPFRRMHCSAISFKMSAGKLLSQVIQ